MVYGIQMRCDDEGIRRLLVHLEHVVLVHDEPVTADGRPARVQDNDIGREPP